jgi:hypothetical protein
VAGHIADGKKVAKGALPSFSDSAFCSLAHTHSASRPRSGHQRQHAARRWGAVAIVSVSAPKTRKDRPNTSLAHAPCSCMPHRGAGAALGSSRRPAPPHAARHSSTSELPLRSRRRGRLLGLRRRGAAAAAAPGGDPASARGGGPERARAGLQRYYWLAWGGRDGGLSVTQPRH